jgi:hypothetical protein
MKPDISEFSYGYAVTEELIRGYLPPITAAPLFPSLIQEGQPGGGYDVMLQAGSVPVFLQFKLSDYMVRNSAVEVGLGILATPFYRMHLRPRGHSNQHQMLLDLENSGNMVYYVAPAFHQPWELNSNYVARRVAQNSIFVSPNTIGALPDDDYHHVAFRLGGPAWFLSEPSEIRHKLDAETFVQQISEKIKVSEGGKGLRESAQLLASTMIGIVGKHPMWRDSFRPPDFESFQRQLSPLQQIVYLSRTFFDCEIVIAKKG